MSSLEAPSELDLYAGDEGFRNTVASELKNFSDFLNSTSPVPKEIEIFVDEDFMTFSCCNFGAR